MLGAAISKADTLELKNGSLIKGRFVGGTETEIKFQIGSSVQRFNVGDIVSLKFDSEEAAGDQPGTRNHASEVPLAVTIPAGTQLSVRTIDSIDSTKSHAGDRFQATLEEPLVVDGNVVVAKGADVYGKLAESKTSGTFTGRSELRLELTRIVVNGQTGATRNRRISIKWQVTRGEHCEENRWWSGGRNDHCHRRWRQGCSHWSGRRWRCRRRIGNHHQGRPGQSAQRDFAGFYGSASSFNAGAAELVREP